MDWQRLRNTRTDGTARAVRIVLGALFVMTGAMKLMVPMLAAAWAGQLAAANIPLQEVNRWVVPFAEMGVGAALLVGVHTRIAALLVMSIMIVAIYVHVVVDPSLFPLQPSEPIIPAVVIVLAAYVLVRGGGSGSKDLNTTESAPP